MQVADAKTGRAASGSKRVVLFINSCNITCTTNQTAWPGNRNRAGKLTTLELQNFSAVFRI
jgi:hypothetical protein